MRPAKPDHANAIFEVWEVLLQYRWRFVVPAFLVSAAVLATSLFLPRKYKAEAIFERRTDAVLAEVTSRAGAGGGVKVQDPRATVTEELKGGPAIDQVMQRLDHNGALHSPAGKSDLRQDIARYTLVTWDINDGDHERIRVQFTGSDPQVAQAVVNTLVRNYIGQARQRFEDQLRETSEFYRQEMQRHRQAVEKAESEALAYEIRHADLLPDTPNNIQTRMADADARIDELEAARDALSAQVRSLEAALTDEPASIESLVRAKNPELTRLEEKLRELEDRLVEATKVRKMTDAHPEVVAIRAQVQTVRDTIASTAVEVVSQRQELVNPKRRELELRLETAESELATLSGQITNAKSERAELSARSNLMLDVRRDYRRLQRQVEDAQRQVGFWEDNLRQIELALTADAGDRGVRFEFIRPATASMLPVSPNLAQVLMGAVVMGLLAGALNVFFTHRTNEAFGDGERAARAMDLQLFGAVSEIVTDHHRRIRRLRRLVLYPANAVLMGGVLLALVTLLYIDLRQPHVMRAWKAAGEPATAAEADPALRTSLAYPTQPEPRTELP